VQADLIKMGKMLISAIPETRFFNLREGITLYMEAVKPVK